MLSRDRARRAVGPSISPFAINVKTSSRGHPYDARRSGHGPSEQSSSAHGDPNGFRRSSGCSPRYGEITDELRLGVCEQAVAEEHEARQLRFRQSQNVAEHPDRDGRGEFLDESNSSRASALSRRWQTMPAAIPRSDRRSRGEVGGEQLTVLARAFGGSNSKKLVRAASTARASPRSWQRRRALDENIFVSLRTASTSSYFVSVQNPRPSGRSGRTRAPPSAGGRRLPRARGRRKGRGRAGRLGRSQSRLLRQLRVQRSSGIRGMSTASSTSSSNAMSQQPRRGATDGPRSGAENCSMADPGTCARSCR